jgi:toxin FitB
VTFYLLDANVLRELHPGGHENVRAWLRNIDDSRLRLSAMTIFELRKGRELQRRRDPQAAERGIAAINLLEAAYRDRIIPIDAKIAAEWARLVGEKDKHRDDLALAATARIHELVLVTRNVEDFRGRGVRLLDPFRNPPVIVFS